MSREDYKEWAKELSQSLDTDKALILPIDDMGEYWGGLKAIMEHAPDRVLDYLDAGLSAQNGDQYKLAAVVGLMEKTEVLINPEVTNYLLEKLRKKYIEQPGRYLGALSSVLTCGLSMFEREDFREVISMLIDKHNLADRKDLSCGNTECSAIGVIAQSLAGSDHTIYQAMGATQGQESAILRGKLTKWKDNARELVKTLVERQNPDIEGNFLEQELTQLCRSYNSWPPQFDYAGIDLLLEAGARWEALVKQPEEHPEYQALLTRPAVIKHRLEKVAGVVVGEPNRSKPKI